MENSRQINSFTDLLTRKEAHQLCLLVYKLSAGFPSSEQFGLTSQIRRAAVSVTSNIAEGFGRSTKPDREHFYVMSAGSLFEVKNQLILARDLNFISKEDFEKAASQANSAHKLLNALLKAHRAFPNSKLQTPNSKLQKGF